MNKKDDFHSVISVLGISMGDEGKGRVVHEILDHIESGTGSSAAGVIKVNGGANAGHTAAGLKLNLLPSGVGNPRVNNLLIGSGVVADPRKFLWEAKPLEARGISVLRRLKIDEKCQMSDLCHRLLDLAWETYRVQQLGQENRGSTGRGISPAYCDETGQWQIFYQSFLLDRKEFSSALKERMQRAMDTIRFVCKVSEADWFSFFDVLTDAETRANRSSIEDGIFSPSEFDFKVFLKSNPFEINFELLEEIYWNTGQDLVSCIDDVRELLLSFKETKKSVVAEFGQAYWLDKRHGFTPNVTASHTSGAEFFHSGGIPISKISQVGCCKAYDTKVGTHHFITQLDQTKNPWGAKLSKLEFGTSTGRQRMVGWFDAVEKGNALRYCGFDHLVINKLDALTANQPNLEELKICKAYQLPDGTVTKIVPRAEIDRKKIIPVYETFQLWTEDLQSLNSFEDFPVAAQRYVSRMVGTLLEVAYPEGFADKKLPRILFIGVGPEPGQIITDVPETGELIRSFASNSPSGIQ